ncbi:hypothetical protein LGN17_35915 [Burkholderia sp. AU30280]|uniref:hypothetical protein n=1 Tax=Burkholderia sp. AU30280 TaxID=2879628 RepID=UPI001CF3C0A5|nr:hypothetical protein [Burkholderia sp. AU30280]MCA8277867.1 hypothetical protein [Burkholderia sp. AU30280]
MSDLNATQGADGATNAGDGTTDIGLTPAASGIPEAATLGEPVGSPGAPPGAADSGSETAAASADTPLSTGTQSQSSGGDGMLAALEDGAGELVADAVNNAPPAVEAAAVTFVPMMVRVEQLARRAFDAGATDEHNLMAWLYQHVEALHRAIVGAPGLPLSDDAKALIAELKGLL